MGRRLPSDPEHLKRKEEKAKREEEYKKKLEDEKDAKEIEKVNMAHQKKIKETRRKHRRDEYSLKKRMLREEADTHWKQQWDLRKLEFECSEELEDVQEKIRDKNNVLKGEFPFCFLFFVVS